MIATHRTPGGLGARLPGPGDDGSIAIALLVVLLGMSLGSLMLPMLITQAQATHFDETRLTPLNAAQAGIDVMLGRIRSSTVDGGNVGDAAKLPCYSRDAPLAGWADSPETGLGKYQTYVTYMLNTPTGDKPMKCSPDLGTFVGSRTRLTPDSAVIHSAGIEGTAPFEGRGRDLVTTYTFQTDETKVSGGVIRLYPASEAKTSWCMDAGPAPAPGTPLVLQECATSSASMAQQAFVYRSDLSLQLASSVGDTNARGLCVDTRDSNHYLDGNQVVLAECDKDPAVCSDARRCSPWNQQWSMNDNAHLEGATTDQSSTDGRCIEASTAEAGTALVLNSCRGGTDDPQQSWIPAPSAGAGMAAANQQLVNFLQFSRCLDVTSQDPYTSFLIVYSCKQNQNPDSVSWNQKFTPSVPLADAPTTTLIQTTRWGQSFCLTSPGTDGGLVNLTASCPGGPSSSDPSTWTVYRTQDADHQGLPYAQMFTIVDSSGRCLGLEKNAKANGSYSKATVSRCDGSRSQKWNAVASLDAPTVSNTHE